jgi:hypothetical protein
VLSRADRGSSPGYQHLDPEPDQLSREVGEPLDALPRIASLQDEVLALDIAEVVQTLPEGLFTWIGLPVWEANTEPTDPMPCRRRRRLGGERRHDKADSEGDDEPEGAARHGSLL